MIGSCTGTPPKDSSASDFPQVFKHVLFALEDLVQSAAIRVFDLVDLAGALIDRFGGPEIQLGNIQRFEGILYPVLVLGISFRADIPSAGRADILLVAHEATFRVENRSHSRIAAVTFRTGHPISFPRKTRLRMFPGLLL